MGSKRRVQSAGKPSGGGGSFSIPQKPGGLFRTRRGRRGPLGCFQWKPLLIVQGWVLNTDPLTGRRVPRGFPGFP